jgi:two-component system sensor histidine kinase VanS
VYYETCFLVLSGSCRNRGRSGLGLAIVKKSLDRMGIPFGLENTGEGVVFWMDVEAAG